MRILARKACTGTHIVTARRFWGCMNLELVKTEESGPMLAKIKENADATVGPGTGAAVTHTAWFKVFEVRPLI